MTFYAKNHLSVVHSNITTRSFNLGQQECLFPHLWKQLSRFLSLTLLCHGKCCCTPRASPHHLTAMWTFLSACATIELYLNTWILINRLLLYGVFSWFIPLFTTFTHFRFLFSRDSISITCEAYESEKRDILTGKTTKTERNHEKKRHQQDLLRQPEEGTSPKRKYRTT